MLTPPSQNLASPKAKRDQLVVHVTSGCWACFDGMSLAQELLNASRLIKFGLVFCLTVQSSPIEVCRRLAGYRIPR